MPRTNSPCYDNLVNQPLKLVGFLIGVIDFVLLFLTSFNQCNLSEELDNGNQIECQCDASAVTLYNLSGQNTIRCKWTTSTCVLCWLSLLSLMLIFVLEIFSFSSKSRIIKVEWAILSVFGYITSRIMIKNVVDEDCDQYKLFNIRCEIALFEMSIFFHLLFCSFTTYFYIKNKTQIRPSRQKQNYASLEKK